MERMGAVARQNVGALFPNTVPLEFSKWRTGMSAKETWTPGSPYTETDEQFVPEIPEYLGLFCVGDCGGHYWVGLEKKGNGDLR